VTRISVCRAATKRMIAILTLLYCYRDGESLDRQAIRILPRSFGAGLCRFVRA